MRGFILVIGILALVSCDTGDGVKQTETGTVSTDSGDAPVDTESQEGPQDRDGDGFYDDCDDDNAAIYPGATETCDGLDNDCDGQVDDDAIDAAPWYLDSDGDGYGDAEEDTLACEAPVDHVSNDSDCNDADATFHPGATESDCTDPSDYNCDGSVGYVDEDGDGHPACEDCDDTEAGVHESQPETCDGLDNDCNGFVDSDDPNLVGGTTWYADVDGDGHGANHFMVEACEQPEGYVDNSDDCDDLEPLSYPSAAEICDEKDNDCDGDIDEGVGFTWYADTDGDGYGDATQTTSACDAPQGYTANGNDCDDTSPATNPSAYEICDGVDNNCDGSTDDASALNASTFYTDADSDGYGDGASSVTACEAPSNHVNNDGDCDDTNAAANPGADEVCDGADNDCDGTADEASSVDATTWYTDSDSDSYGDASTAQVACTAPSGTVMDATDCDDTSATTNPGATETCNGTDDNCDGATDEGVLSTWYADFDSDGYGSSSISQEACAAPAAYVADNTDCNDVDGSVNPGASEACDSADTDEDCDGAADDNDPEGASGTTTYYPDVDGDGYGDQSDAGTGFCDDAGTRVTDNTDCDDTATGAAIYPGATDTWYDGVDSDCDGANDYDADGDGIDSDAHSGADCNDNNASINANCYLYTFTSHSFTTCGTSGQNGPALSTCQGSYSTNWDNDTNYLNMTVNGIQRWTVPATASYRIAATGAEGQTNSAAYAGGTPATVQGDIDLTQGEIINILVGQVGNSNSTHGNENGGGGGSFVVRDTGTAPLVIAGGGGGAPSHSYSSNCTRTNGDGQLGTAGNGNDLGTLGTAGKTVNCLGTGTGGTNGNGGSTGGDNVGGAGGGLLGNGATGGGHCSTSGGGAAFVNGGVGGEDGSCYGPAQGGFGGGGSGGLGSPGGAGGYSGGGAAGNWSSYADYGGGGGSYNAGTNPSATVSGSGSGSVTITLLSLN